MSAENVDRIPEAEIVQEEDFDLEEERLLEGYVKKNAAAESSKFTMLYIVVALTAVVTVSYLFHAILDLSFANKINAALYLIAGGVTVYILSESYKQTYDAVQASALGGSEGKWIRDLEERRVRRHASIPEGTPELKIPGGAQGLSAKDIYIKSEKGTDDGWKKLTKGERQVYASQEAKAAVKYLGYELAQVNNLLFQQTMGEALFAINFVFVGIALVISQLILRNYDSRASFVFATIGNSVVTHLIVKKYYDTEESVDLQKKRN